MIRHILSAGASVLALSLTASLAVPAAGANAQAPAAQSVAPNDYSDGAAWLCRPGRNLDQRRNP